MDSREFEEMLERIMKTDLSGGTEEFREKLLERCLAVLDEDDECAEVADSELDLLAAAGDAFQNCQPYIPKGHPSVQ